MRGVSGSWARDLPAILLLTLLVAVPAAGDAGSAGAPERARELMRRAISALQQSPPDKDAFLALCRQAAELAPRSSVIQNNLGYAYELAGRYEEAARHYREARELDPGWKVPCYGLADVRLKQGRIAEAMRLYEEGFHLPCRNDEDRASDAETRRRVAALQHEMPGFIDRDLLVEFIRGHLTSGSEEPRARGLLLHFERDAAAGNPAGGLDLGGAPDPPCEERLMLQHVYFGLDEYRVAADVHEQVDVLGEALQETAGDGVVIRLIGHASPDGPAEYNWALSRRRALAVRDYLVERFGIPLSRLEVSWKGETEPVRDETGRVDLEKSRRVEIGRRCAPAVGAYSEAGR